MNIAYILPAAFFLVMLYVIGDSVVFILRGLRSSKAKLHEYTFPVAVGLAFIIVALMMALSFVAVLS